MRGFATHGEANTPSEASAERAIPNENIYYLTERGTEVCDAILEELV